MFWRKIKASVKGETFGVDHLITELSDITVRLNKHCELKAVEADKHHQDMILATQRRDAAVVESQKAATIASRVKAIYDVG